MTTIDRIANMFEAFAPADVPRLDAWYTPEAYFKDPFNEVRGLAAIQGIYAHMFETLDDPRFIVTHRIADGAMCFLVWEFRFRLRRWKPGEVQLIRGASHLRLAEDGRIEWHRDYWDAAEELYEKLPMVGALMRWLRGRVRAA